MNTDNIKAVLFDLDGVVFDTEPQYTVFWGAYLYGGHPVPFADMDLLL